MEKSDERIRRASTQAILLTLALVGVWVWLAEVERRRTLEQLEDARKQVAKLANDLDGALEKIHELGDTAPGG
jgi:hypothetical protein